MWKINFFVVCLRLLCILCLFSLFSNLSAAQVSRHKASPKSTVKIAKKKQLVKPTPKPRQLTEAEISEQWRRKFLAALQQKVEKELSTWQRGSENSEPPGDGLLCSDAVLSGLWGTGTRWSSTNLIITSRAEGGLSVDFTTGGCEGAWSLKRIGHLEAGVLTLNKPVKSYPDGTFDRLYVVRVRDTELLVPDLYLTEFRRYLTAKDGKVSENAHWTYYRKNP